MVGLPGTYGALLLGALFASGYYFSGILLSQCIVYIKLFPRDSNFLKVLVLVVWLFDLTHTGFVWSAMWQCMITHQGNSEYIDRIPKSIALSVVLTASLTFLSHCFFAHRIWRLSWRKWYLAAPVLVLAVGRLALASVSGLEMIRLQSYALFRQDFMWLFSLGLGLSSGADILITVLLFFLLHASRSNLPNLDLIIDSLILYTFEIGTLTSVATVISMICWIMLDDSLAFLGLHFVIGKLYANSLLASLNARKDFRRSRTPSVCMSALHSPRKKQPYIQFLKTGGSCPESAGRNVQIDMTKSIQVDNQFGSTIPNLGT